MAQSAWNGASVILILCGLLPAQSAPVREPHIRKQDFSTMRAFVQKRMAEERIPSVAVAVSQDGKIL
jgi:CubicO group peptidase (beta-lactamase class C family)